MKRKRVLITGASTGLGKDFAILAAERGMDVILTARSKQLLTQLADELRRKYSIDATSLSLDLSKPDSAWKLMELLKSEGLTFDYLVNNAGFGASGSFTHIDLQTQVEMIHLNMTTLMVLTRLAIEELTKNGGGAILNVASVAAFQPGPFMSVYYATKSFVLHFSEGISKELEGSPVSISVLCPGPTKTEFQERAGIKKSIVGADWFLAASMPVAKEGFEGMLRGKRLIVPGFINKAMIFLERFTPRSVLVSLVAMANKRKS